LGNTYEAFGFGNTILRTFQSQSANKRDTPLLMWWPTSLQNTGLFLKTIAHSVSTSRMLSEGPQESILANPSRYRARSWKQQTLFTMSQTTRLKLQKVRTNANWHGLAPVRSVRKNPCRRSLITYRKQQESLAQAKDMIIDFVFRVGSKREATQSGSPVQGLSASVHCRK